MKASEHEFDGPAEPSEPERRATPPEPDGEDERRDETDEEPGYGHGV